MLHANSLRSLGWAGVIIAALVAFGVLTLKVNTVKSEVRQAERRIVALETEKMMLETEFETRSRQHQLSQWNEVDFGYQAPEAAQFVEGERQLAVFGVPRAPGAPAPIRVAVAEPAIGSAFSRIESPLAGKAFAAEIPDAGRRLRPSPASLTHVSSGAAQ